MKAIIFGDKNRWESALKIIMRHRQDVFVVGLCDPNDAEYAKADDAVLSMDQMLDVYRSGQANAVINIDASIPIWNEWFAAQGVIGNYAISTRYYRESKTNNDSDELVPVLQPYGYIRPELQHIEVHLADHCNLRCKGCTHFSNLVTEPVFPDYHSVERDFERLSRLMYNIKEIHLMGGEPLLNHEVDKYCYMARKAFPYAEIAIATNGLLVPSMSDETLRAIKGNDIMLSISNYTCLDENKIISFLADHGIKKCELRNGKQVFMKNLNPKGDLDPNEVFRACSKRVCTALRDGMIAACIQPFCIRYFNETYKTSLSDGGAINIYDNDIDGYRIIEHLSRPMDACRYCGYEEPFEWAVSTRPVPMSDWCVGSAQEI